MSSPEDDPLRPGPRHGARGHHDRGPGQVVVFPPEPTADGGHPRRGVLRGAHLAGGSRRAQGRRAGTTRSSGGGRAAAPVRPSGSTAWRRGRTGTLTPANMQLPDGRRALLPLVRAPHWTGAPTWLDACQLGLRWVVGRRGSDGGGGVGRGRRPGWPALSASSSCAPHPHADVWGGAHGADGQSAPRRRARTRSQVALMVGNASRQERNVRRPSAWCRWSRPTPLVVFCRSFTRCCGPRFAARASRQQEARLVQLRLRVDGSKWLGDRRSTWWSLRVAVAAILVLQGCNAHYTQGSDGRGSWPRGPTPTSCCTWSRSRGRLRSRERDLPHGEPGSRPELGVQQRFVRRRTPTTSTSSSGTSPTRSHQLARSSVKRVLGFHDAEHGRRWSLVAAAVAVTTGRGADRRSHDRDPGRPGGREAPGACSLE